MRPCRTIGVAVVIGLLAPLAACKREMRPFQSPPAAAAPAQDVDESVLHPGGAPPPAQADYSPLRRNAWGIVEGRRLYGAYNCVGCHANGGGGMGPALMDDAWIYGSQGPNIHNSIVRGRPNGMPAFRNKIAEQQVWMIVAYLQSMGDDVPIDARPGRTDHLQNSASEHVRRAAAGKETER